MQLQWDQINCKIVSENLKTSLDQHRLACFLAASQPHTGALLTVLPTSSLDNLLSNDCLRYVVALHTGSNVCQNFTCRCGEEVDKFGLHPLSCVKIGGRYPRHCALNDIVFRALNVAGFNSILEPSGLDFDASKRPDGVTVFPYKKGKFLTRDVTCTETFSASTSLNSAVSPGSSARNVEISKIGKYAFLQPRYLFTPVVVENSGVFGPVTKSFLLELGNKMKERTSVNLETSWLFQRLSIAIVRGNYLSLSMSCKAGKAHEDATMKV